jgi:hypothetical protein
MSLLPLPLRRIWYVIMLTVANLSNKIARITINIFLRVLSIAASGGRSNGQCIFP